MKKTFASKTFACHSFRTGNWTGVGVASSAPTTDSLEWKPTTNRLHYAPAENRLHYKVKR